MSIKHPRTALGLGLASLLVVAVPQITSAEDASTTLDVTAGIGSALTLECKTDLSFGRTTINPDKHDGEARVDVGANGGVVTSGNAGDLSADDAGSSPGQCTMSGSMGSDGSTVTVTLASDGAFTPEAAEGLDASKSTKTLVLKGLEHSTVDLQQGTATFDIGGAIVIPSVMSRDELGGWTTSISVTVSDET